MNPDTSQSTGQGTGQSTGQSGYAFGRFVLDIERGVLREGDGELRLRPKAFDVLRYLVERPGRLVSREELHDAIWGRAIVTDDVLVQCIGEIRRALGDEQRQLVSTVPRRGYRFELAVTPLSGEPAPERPHAAPPAGGRNPPRAHPRKLGRPLGQRRPARADRRIMTGVRMAGWVILAVGMAVWLTRTGPPPGDGEADARRVTDSAAQFVPAPPLPGNSIAVLPFVDMSPDRDHEHFGDGLAEEILNALAQSPDLKVVARTSSFAFKDRAVDIATVAAVLGVSHVLEGSVRVVDDRVRVTAQLVAASDSTHLWSQSYDRPMGDMLGVQADIAAAVARVLHATLAGAAPEAGREGAIDARAYDHYLRARHLFHRRGKDDLQRAVAQYEAAVAADPGFAAAWAGLSGALQVLMFDYGVVSDARYQQRREAAERAVALAPGMAEAHLRLAAALFEDGETGRAAEHRRIAESLDPDNLLLLTWSTGALLDEGRLEEASERWQQAIARDPLSAVYRFNHAWVLTALRRFGQARLELAVLAELSPDDRGRVKSLEAVILLLEGRPEEAFEVAAAADPGRERDVVIVLAEHALGRLDATGEALERLAADESPRGALGLAETYAMLGEPDAAFRWLDEACARYRAAHVLGQSQCARSARISPFLESLHADPRWFPR